MPLTIGSLAPAFSLKDQYGKLHSLSDFSGRWLIVYFYPKDDTPGCTTEACGIRDHSPEFSEMKVSVVGISPDALDSHREFSEKFKLSFPLLSDTDKKTVTEYEVWAEKSLYGKKYMGVKRTTFLIDPNSAVAKIYINVDPETHVEELLNDLKTITES
jgi:peroxiredoxin Q/BCP